MNSFDVIVIGGGHAGVEASMASAHLGHKTLLLTLNKKMIANTPCNPHIGGSAKGVVVREIDALGGMMGVFADHHPLQIKMLNTGKGPGVQCLRAQVDKYGYPAFAQEIMDKTPNLEIKEAAVVSLLHNEDTVFGVVLEDGTEIESKAVIITTGTYMEGSIISGNDVHPGGPDGEKASIGLSSCLRAMGIETFRLKTGTPPRIDKNTIDFAKGEIQPGQEGDLAFSFLTHRHIGMEKQLPCYLIYTTPKTLEIIRNNLGKSGLFNGLITSAGPRYCPSIESKVVRFADKPRHQLFLEPETEEGNSIYLQGFSTALPHEVQEEMVHSLPGLENAKILKYSYQIEYDAVKPLQFDSTLRIRKWQGLYGAGQICGTSGYEEAAGLGLMAGINACLAIENKEPFILKRNESYIGVMIDDLVTKGTEEPYRLLSSRAEYRLLLRHDNADLRLMNYGHNIGLINEERYASFLKKYETINEAIKVLENEKIEDRDSLSSYLDSKGYLDGNIGHRGFELLKRPGISYKDLVPFIKGLSSFNFDDNDILCVETAVKYSGYIKKEEKDAEYLLKMEKIPLPTDLDYSSLDGLALEARQKLDAVKPHSIAQASRISGVNPADVSVLILTLKKKGLI